MLVPTRNITYKSDMLSFMCAIKSYAQSLSYFLLGDLYDDSTISCCTRL